MARGRRLRVVVPLILGALVTGIALTHPAGAVRGSIERGPIGVPVPALPGLHGRFRIAWTPGHRSIRLTVRTNSGCRPRLSHIASTAPARVEVTVALPSATCATGTTPSVFLLPPPTVFEPGQSVEVRIDGRRFVLPQYRR